MDPNEIMLSRGGGGGNTNGTTGEGFIDRSKVRILLCDNDTKSSEEVFKLLCKCSYQGIISIISSPSHYSWLISDLIDNDWCGYSMITLI